MRYITGWEGIVDVKSMDFQSQTLHFSPLDLVQARLGVFCQEVVTFKPIHNMKKNAAVSSIMSHCGYPG